MKKPKIDVLHHGSNLQASSNALHDFKRNISRAAITRVRKFVRMVGSLAFGCTTVVCTGLRIRYASHEIRAGCPYEISDHSYFLASRAQTTACTHPGTPTARLVTSMSALISFFIFSLHAENESPPEVQAPPRRLWSSLARRC